jgi:hypothetical protein
LNFVEGPFQPSVKAKDNLLFQATTVVAPPPIPTTPSEDHPFQPAPHPTNLSFVVIVALASIGFVVDACSGTRETSVSFICKIVKTLSLWGLLCWGKGKVTSGKELLAVSILWLLSYNPPPPSRTEQNFSYGR